LLSNDSVRFQPEKDPFRIEINIPSAIFPFMRSTVQMRSVIRCILKRTPRSPAAVFKLRCLLGQPLSGQISTPQTGSRGEHATAKVLSKSEHIVEHRFLKIRCREAGWTSILTIPGVDKLVR
jgi:hypothetical protein